MTVQEIVDALNVITETEYEADSSDNMPTNLRREYDGGYYNGSQIVKWDLYKLIKKIKQEENQQSS